MEVAEAEPHERKSKPQSLLWYAELRSILPVAAEKSAERTKAQPAIPSFPIV